MRLFLFLLALLGSTLTSAAPTPGQFSQVTGNWGSNPTNTGFYIYVPKNLASKPGIIVAIHYCMYEPNPARAWTDVVIYQAPELLRLIIRALHTPSLLSSMASSSFIQVVRIAVPAGTSVLMQRLPTTVAETVIRLQIWLHGRLLNITRIPLRYS